MHFSAIVAGLATLSTTSAFAVPFLGSLPSQTITGESFLEDLTTYDSAVTDLVTSLSGLNLRRSAVGNTNQISRVLFDTIRLRASSNTARLDAAGIIVVLNPTDSLAVVNRLTRDILPHFTAATDLLKKAKTAGVLGTTIAFFDAIGVSAPYGFLDLLKFITNDVVNITTSLTKYIDPASLTNFTTVTNNLFALLNATVAAYSLP